MQIVELSIEEFENFATNHPLRNYCQTVEYARFMAELGCTYDYIGYKDNDTIIAASLILYKRIDGFKKFAYAPKGFLIDYYNINIVKSFIEDLEFFLKPKKIVFIKIDPEIIIGELKLGKTFGSEYNKNVKIIDELKDVGYKRRREVKPLELIKPRINPFINLKKYNLKKLDSNISETIELSQLKGLEYDFAACQDIRTFYNFLSENTARNISYYRNFLNIFSKSNMADLVLIKINYKNFLLKAKQDYDNELENNNNLNELIQTNATEKNINQKMTSDKTLLQLKNNIVEATEGLKKDEAEYIAGALVVKYQNRVTVIDSGYSSAFESLAPKYFLYNKLVEIYKDEYDYIDLNGLSSDFSSNAKDFQTNQFKLDFKPVIYEYIGEFDYIFNEYNFKNLQRKGIISKEMDNLK